MEIFRLDGIIAPMHLFAFVSDNLHGGGRVHSCPSQVGRGTMPEIMQPKPRHPCPAQAAAKAVRGFFHGFPLYRNTREVSRRRSLCNSEKVSKTSGVMGMTRVSPFLVLRSVNSRRRMSTSGHSNLSNSPSVAPVSPLNKPLAVNPRSVSMGALGIHLVSLYACNDNVGHGARSRH